MKTAVMRNRSAKKGIVPCAATGCGIENGHIWKNAALNRREFPLFPYPNAATAREIAHKIVDHLLIFACCVAMAAAFLLMIAIA